MTNTCLRWLSPLTAVVALALTSGCSDLDNCPDARDLITIDRPESTDTETLIFESSAGWNNFDEFPAKTELKFKHGLGVTPWFVKSYVSFTANAANGKEGGSFTESAGNIAAWECADSDAIVIKNDTCERSFFVKVVALGSPNGDPNDNTCDE